MPSGELISKVAAHYAIKKEERANHSTKDIAVKYQVLSKSTAFIGVHKDLKSDKIISSSELKQVSITE